MLPPFIKRPVFDLQEGRDLYFPGLETPRALGKLAGELHPEIAAWLQTWKSHPNFPVVVIAPMGASEFWSSNSNADLWPEEQLNPPSGTWDYGYKTFEQASLFEHHRNKSPEETRGRIPLSVWDPRMHRIEVVAVYDRDRCHQLGSYHLLEAIDRGEFFPVSMGSRVAHDVCTICGHVAKSAAEHCDHIRTMGGQVLPDGRLVGMINIRPRFFDLSAVHVPAAKESGILAKVASDSRRGVASDSAVAARPLPRRVERRRFPLKLSEEKSAEIDKRVLSNVRQQVVDPLTRTEPPVSPLLLRRLSSYPLERPLATLGYGGAVLSPREFTCMALHRAGHHEMAGGLPGDLRLPWSYPEARPEPYDIQEILGDLLRALRSVFAERSVSPRVMMIRIQALPEAGPPHQAVASKVAAHPLPGELLTGLGQLYGEYRGRLLSSLGSDTRPVFASYPQLLDPSGLERSFGKTAMVAGTKDRVLTKTSGALYLACAHGESVLPPWWSEVEGPLLNTLSVMEAR